MVRMGERIVKGGERGRKGNGVGWGIALATNGDKTPCSFNSGAEVCVANSHYLLKIYLHHVTL